MSALPTPVDGPVVVAEIVRSGFVEGHHYGSVVALDADGGVDWSVGAVDVPVLPRSSQQADPGARHGPARARPAARPARPGLRVALGREVPRRRAPAGSSASAGLDESALQTPPDYPLDDAAREELIRAGGVKAPVLMNCSGKHAAMLATCVANGWDTATYLRPAAPAPAGHPRHLRRAHRRAGRRSPSTAAVPRCCPPRSTGLARAFRALAVATDGPERRVADAMRAHPEYVSGTHPRRAAPCSRALPGAIGKAGAESVYAVALPDGRAFALKTDDGAPRVRPVLMAEALRRSGVLERARRGRRGRAPHRRASSCSAAAGRWARSGPALT